MTDAAETVTYWEGEWSPLKAAVRGTRHLAVDSYAAARALVTERCIDAVRGAVRECDARVHRKCVATSCYVQANPWLGRGAAIGAATGIVARESLRWGWSGAGTARNAAVFGAVATVAVFPEGCKAAVRNAFFSRWSTSE
jgi:ElaB/YqjD/DUF883 family membrane-anchored ribosome-binding protein